VHEAGSGYRGLANSLLPSWSETTGEYTLTRLIFQQSTYAAGQSIVDLIPSNIASLALNLPRVAAGLVSPLASWSAALREPSFWLYGGVLLAGLLWPLRRGNPLLTLSGLSFLLFLPFIGAG